VNAPLIHQLIRDVTGRRGAQTLLRHLGFPDSLQPNGLREHIDVPVAAAFTTRGDLVRACLVEVLGRVDGDVVRNITRGIRAADPVTLHLYLIAEKGYARFALCCDGPDRAVRHLLLDR
jgi:hypothetical protein